MPITISGSGTITGLTTGGLPDGSIAAGDLSSTLDLTGKTVTLPAGTGGKILQVVQGSYNTTVAMTTNSFQDTGLSKTITPVAANSNFYIIVDQRSYMTAAGQGFGLRIMRDTTALHIPSQDNNGGYDWYEARDAHIRATLTYLDTTASYTLGDTLTYKTQCRQYTSSGISFQVGSNSTGYSYITIMEVAA